MTLGSRRAEDSSTLVQAPVLSMSPHEHHTRKILTEIETGRPVTQGRLSRELGPAERGTPDGLLTDKRIVFYGAGEVAEIGYVSLQATDLRLVGTRRVFV